MKRTILFVDDEPNVLLGLKRMLRPMRDKWNLFFAESGQEALKIMAVQSIDAVVSDMRMPGMDGPEFLRRVQRDYPDTIRFALSGYSDHEMVNQSIAPTHRYLSKPCEEKLLVEALEQAMGARQLVSNRGLLDKLSRIENLPVLPEIYTRITLELSKGDPSPKAIGDIVATDVGMSANILKLVNSSYFGLPRHIAAPQQAVIILGVNVIRSLIISLHVFNSLGHLDGESFSLRMLWEHSMRTACIARAIAKSEGLSKDEEDHAYISALMHDLGKLIMQAHCVEEYCLVLAEVRASNRRVADVEVEQLGLTHAQIGAYLLGLWGLPDTVVHAVAQHHDPLSSSGGLCVADVVYFANLLDHETCCINAHYATTAPSSQRLDAIGGAERYAAWKGLTLLKLVEEKL